MKAEFSQEELELLAQGFGFYVQESPLDDNNAHALLAKLYQLIGTEEDTAGPPPKAV